MKDNYFNENNEKFNDYVEENYTYLKDNFIQDKDIESIFKEYLLENIISNNKITKIDNPTFVNWYEITLNCTKIEYPLFTTINGSTKIRKTVYKTWFTILLDKFIDNNESLFIEWVIEHVN